MRDYCKQYVTKMGVDAEGPFIELGLLPLTLGCRCTIIYLDRIQGNELKAFESGVEASETVSDESTAKVATNESTLLGHVHLLLRPGHYDLLYLETPIPPTYRELLSDEEVEVATIIPSSNTRRPSRSPAIIAPSTQQTTMALSDATSDVTINLPTSTNDNLSMTSSVPSSPSVPGSPKREQDKGARALTNESLESLPLPPASLPFSSSNISSKPVNPPPVPLAPSMLVTSTVTPTAQAMSQTTVPVPSDSMEKQEMARQLCEILSISNAEALDLCKRNSTVESAVAFYYESQEAKKRQRRKSSFSSMLRNGLSRGKERDRDRIQQLEYEQQVYLDQQSIAAFDPVYQDNPYMDHRQKVNHLCQLIGVSEEEAKLLLTRFDGSIIDAADHYQRLLAQDIPSMQTSKPSASTIRSNMDEAFDIRSRSSSQASSLLSFPRLFGKSSTQDSPSTPQNQTDAKPMSDGTSRENPLNLSSISHNHDTDITMVEAPDGEVIVSYTNPSHRGRPPSSYSSSSSPQLSTSSPAVRSGGLFSWLGAPAGSTSPTNPNRREMDAGPADSRADSKVSSRSPGAQQQQPADKKRMFSLFKKRSSISLKTVEDVLRLDRDDVSSMDLNDCKKALRVLLGRDSQFLPTASAYREELLSLIDDSLRERSASKSLTSAHKNESSGSSYQSNMSRDDEPRDVRADSK
jgi:hypothetical protein